MLPLSNLVEMELDRGLENDCGCTFIATVEAFSILLTTDFISTQQKLSSVFTMESDCPERIGQMEHFKTLTIKRREINRDLETEMHLCFKVPVDSRDLSLSVETEKGLYCSGNKPLPLL